MERREQDTFGVAQRERIAGGKRLRDRLGNVQRDGNRPQRPVGETHRQADPVVLLASHEPAQR